MTTSRDSGPRPGPRRTTAVRKRPQATPRSPQSELVQEQKYSDHAFRVHRESVEATQKMRNAPSATVADHRAKQNTLAGEAPLTDKDPVAFGWAEDGDGKRFYVGKTSILDESKRALVVNWKSKLGDRYMSAMAGDDQGLAQKRTFTHDAQRILRYSDTHFLDRGHSAARDDARKNAGRAGQGESHESASFTIDDAVLSAMESHRDSKMHDIVATIQADQYRVLTHDPAAMLLIQGGPGTGKTAVALHRLSWLLYNQRGVLEPADVLVVTPNPTLTRYIRDVLPALGDEGIRQIAIQELTRDLAAVRAREMHEVATLKSDIRFRDVIRQGLRQRIGLSGDRLVFRSRAGRGSAHLDGDVVEATYRRYLDLPYLAGRQAFIQQLQAELIDRYPLPRRSTFEETYDVRYFTAQADRVWPSLSPHRFLYELLGSKRRMVMAADQIFPADDAEKLVRTTAAAISDEKWTEADTFLLHEIQAQLSPTSLPRFGHIIIDEAQDLSGMQVQAIKRRSKSGAMTLSGDVAQSTGATRRDSWDSLMEILVDKEPGQSWSHEEVTRKTLRYVY